MIKPKSPKDHRDYLQGVVRADTSLFIIKDMGWRNLATDIFQWCCEYPAGMEEMQDSSPDDS